MKCETALRRILESDSSDGVKMVQLWCLAARQPSGSHNQELVRKHWEIYYNKVNTKERK